MMKAWIDNGFNDKYNVYFTELLTFFLYVTEKNYDIWTFFLMVRIQIFNKKRKKKDNALK